MVFLEAVQSVLSIIFMITIGYFLSSKGWFDEKSSKLLSKLVVNLSLPAYMISNLVSNYSKDELLKLGSGLVIPFSSMILCYLIAIAAARLIKIPGGRAGTFCSMFAWSNTIFIGLPVNLALFGDESIPYVLLYYIANTTLFWTIGVYGISRDGGNSGGKLFSASNIKRIFSPPLTGFLIAIALIMLGIRLPQSILDTCRYLGNLTTPLSMLFIGIIIHSVKIREIKADKEMVVLLAGRFLVAPLLVFAMSFVLPIPLLMKKVFVIQAGMPAMTQTSIVAESYDADYKYAAVMTAATTIVSLVSIPLYMTLFSFL